MKQVIIENPILNSPYVEPRRHFKFSDEGITSDIEENRFINRVRERVALWQQGGYLGVAGVQVSTTRALWVPAINNHGGFGRWAFLEISDPWNAKRTIRAALKK